MKATLLQGERRLRPGPFSRKGRRCGARWQASQGPGRSRGPASTAPQCSFGLLCSVPSCLEHCKLNVGQISGAVGVCGRHSSAQLGCCFGYRHIHHAARTVTDTDLSSQPAASKAGVDSSRRLAERCNHGVAHPAAPAGACSCETCAAAQICVCIVRSSAIDRTELSANSGGVLHQQAEIKRHIAAFFGNACWLRSLGRHRKRLEELPPNLVTLPDWDKSCSARESLVCRQLAAEDVDV